MYKITPLFLLITLLLASGCSDVLVDDLSDEQVQLKAPVNGLITTNQVQAFWWDELEDQVDGYRIEIVSPRFDSIVELVLVADVTDGNIYETTLPSGNYQWTVVAYNSRNETKPMLYDLTIESDSTMDLSSQSLLLVSPLDELSSNETDVTFLWQQLVGANNYKLQVASPDFSNSTYFVLEEDVIDDFYSTTLSEGSYQWRVRAENDNSVTPYISRGFTIDLTAPSAPELLAPNFGDTLSLPVSLSWQTDIGIDMSTLYVATDSLFTAQILELNTSSTSHTFSDNTSSVYFWQVGTVDAAGNESELSEIRKFFVE